MFEAKATNDVLELLIYGSISAYGDVSSAVVARTLAEHPNAKTIKLRVNSLGGSVFEGAALYSALMRHPAVKECDIDGVAASAASWPVLACSKRRMGASALYMVHEASGDTWGPASEHEKTAALLRKMNEQQIELYTQSSKLTREDVAAAVEAETWYTASEALAAGFATEVGADVKPKARAAFTGELHTLGFRHAPADKLAAFYSFAAGPRPAPAPAPTTPEPSAEMLEARKRIAELELIAEGGQLETLIRNGWDAHKVTPHIEARLRLMHAERRAPLAAIQEFVGMLMPIKALANAKLNIQAPAPDQRGGAEVFRAMTPSQRATLKREDRETYNAMRNEWIAAGRPAPMAGAA
jgi:ATP-dependent Clp protease protease subunit